MSAIRFTKEHEWVRQEGDIVVIGITDYAQSQLGDVVYVELPEPGRILSEGDVFGTVESVKAVSDLYSPVGGEVVESLRERILGRVAAADLYSPESGENLFEANNLLDEEAVDAMRNRLVGLEQNGVGHGWTVERIKRCSYLKSALIEPPPVQIHPPIAKIAMAVRMIRN